MKLSKVEFVRWVGVIIILGSIIFWALVFGRSIAYSAYYYKTYEVLREAGNCNITLENFNITQLKEYQQEGFKAALNEWELVCGLKEIK